jgi:hypothetical protein
MEGIQDSVLDGLVEVGILVEHLEDPTSWTDCSSTSNQGSPHSEDLAAPAFDQADRLGEVEDSRTISHYLPSR